MQQALYSRRKVSECVTISSGNGSVHKRRLFGEVERDGRKWLRRPAVALWVALKHEVCVVCPCVCMFVCLSVCLHVLSGGCLYWCRYVCIQHIPMRLSVCLFVYLSVYIYLSVCLSRDQWDAFCLVKVKLKNINKVNVRSNPARTSQLGCVAYFSIIYLIVMTKENAKSDNYLFFGREGLTNFCFITSTNRRRNVSTQLQRSGRLRCYFYYAEI